MTDNPEALGLEQKCRRPGEWMIEGYLVRRVGYQSWGKGHVDWLIYEPGSPTTVYDTPAHMTRRLNEAREWIRSQL